MGADGQVCQVEHQPRPRVANDNRGPSNPTVVDLPSELSDEILENLARTLARVLVARAYTKRQPVPNNDI